MNKMQFTKVIESLDALIEECEETVFKSTDDANNAPYKDVQERFTKACELKSKMDRVLQAELYHIIGMGNLSADQSMKLIRKIKQYGDYRPYIQVMCGMQPPVMPKIPANSKYTCEVLGTKLKRHRKVEENGQVVENADN